MEKHPVTALIPFLRDELASSERDGVARHLDGCNECRELTNSLAAVSAELTQLVERMPGPDLGVYRAELARKLAAREEPRRRLWRPTFVWIPLATAGAAAIALFLILGIHRQPAVPSIEQLATGYELSQAGVGLLRDYPVVTNLDLLEDYDIIEHLNELPDANDQQQAAHA
jgi:anti-sigma factor RsiW